MSEATDPTAATNGEAAPPPAAPEGAKPSAAAKLAAHPRVQQAIARANPKVKQAIALAKEHPLGAVATVAAAAALVEVEFAVGILAGLGATALLARKTGPEAREQVIARGKKAIEQARVAIAKRRKAAATPEVTPPPAS